MNGFEGIFKNIDIFLIHIYGAEFDRIECSKIMNFCIVFNQMIIFSPKSGFFWQGTIFQNLNYHMYD